jgi:hypothetical protein
MKLLIAAALGFQYKRFKTSPIINLHAELFYLTQLWLLYMLKIPHLLEKYRVMDDNYKRLHLKI